MDKAIIINDMIGRTFVSIDGGEKGSEEWLGESNGYYSEEVAVCSSEHPRGW